MQNISRSKSFGKFVLIVLITQGNQAMPVKTNQPVLPVQCSDLGGRGGIDMALITAILAGF